MRETTRVCVRVCVRGCTVQNRKEIRRNVRIDVRRNEKQVKKKKKIVITVHFTSSSCSRPLAPPPSLCSLLFNYSVFLYFLLFCINRPRPPPLFIVDLFLSLFLLSLSSVFFDLYFLFSVASCVSSSPATATPPIDLDFFLDDTPFIRIPFLSFDLIICLACFPTNDYFELFMLHVYEQSKSIFLKKFFRRNALINVFVVNTLSASVSSFFARISLYRR